MEDLRRLLLLRVLVVLGPCVMLLWLRFGLTPPQPLPFLAVALFLGWGALAFVAVHPFARRRKPVTAWELFAYLQLDVLALALLLFFSGGRQQSIRVAAAPAADRRRHLVAGRTGLGDDGGHRGALHRVDVPLLALARHFHLLQSRL